MKDNQKAQEVMNTSFTMVCGSGIILMIAGMLFARPLLVLFGASEDALVYAYPYMMIYLIGTIPSMIATGMNPFINAQGYATTGMLSVAIGAVANLILDPFLCLVSESKELPLRLFFPSSYQLLMYYFFLKKERK